MNSDATYKLVKNRLDSEYDFHFNDLKDKLSEPVNEIVVRSVVEILTIMATLRMKLEILNAAMENMDNPNQQLLFS